MTQMLILLGLVVISAGLVIYSLLPDRKEEEEKVRRRMAGKRSQSEQPLAAVEKKQSAAKQMLEKVAPYAMKPVMPRSDEEMSSLRGKLAQAGYRHESVTRYFLSSMVNSPSNRSELG